MENELLEAAKALLPFLKASTDHFDMLAEADTNPPSEAIALIRSHQRPRETPAQRLRREADELEAKDAAIQRFRTAVAASQGV